MGYPHLPKAPIVEGLIDIHVKQRPELSLDDLAPFTEALRSSYPDVKDLREIHAQFVVSDDPKALPSNSGPKEIPRVGHRFERPSPHFVVHARRSELLVSKLRPYDSWETLAAEARATWTTYRDILKPEAITRVATRFVNRLELPLKGLDFDEYLSAPPLIPKGLPQVFDNFMTRIIVPDANSGSRIAISQVLEGPNPQSDTISVLIDIDVFKEVDIDVASEELWQLLARMRDIKNRAFFDSVTQRALELFR